MKEFLAELESVEKLPCVDGYRYVLVGRNGDVPLLLGDLLNHCKIIKIEAYGRELDMCGQGMTARLTIEGKYSMAVLLKESKST
jgi:hypothetical protein